MTDITEADAGAQALSVAVPGARGWFRFSGDGRVNVRTAGAVQTTSYDESGFRIIVASFQGVYELALGPYEDAGVAGAVCDAVLALAYNDPGWPASTIDDAPAAPA